MDLNLCQPEADGFYGVERSSTALADKRPTKTLISDRGLFTCGRTSEPTSECLLETRRGLLPTSSALNSRPSHAGRRSPHHPGSLLGQQQAKLTNQVLLALNKEWAPLLVGEVALNPPLLLKLEERAMLLLYSPWFCPSLTVPWIVSELPCCRFSERRESHPEP